MSTQHRSVLSTPCFRMIFAIPRRLGPVVCDGRGFLCATLCRTTSSALDRLTTSDGCLKASVNCVYVLRA